MMLTRRQRYNALKKLAPEVIAATIDVEILSRAISILDRLGNVTLTTNLVEWREGIEVEAHSIIESIDELAEYPQWHQDRFEKEWRQYFEEELK